MVNIEAVERCIVLLQVSLDHCRRCDASKNVDLARVFRLSAAKNFEMAFETSHKVLRRYLKLTEPSLTVVQRQSFPDIIRLAYDRGVVAGEWKDWAEYRRLRSLTEYTYRAGYAEEILSGIPGFLNEARFMVAAMKASPPPPLVIQDPHKAVSIETEHLDIIVASLQKHSLADIEIWAYGSRATGQNVRRGSDLDLILKAETALEPDILSLIADELSDSLLPYMVDLHDWHQTSSDFLTRIEPDMIPLPVLVQAGEE